MKLIDAHTHLNTGDLYPQREEYLSQFVQAGGVGLVNSGASEEYNIRGVEIAKKMEMLKHGKMGKCVVKSTIGYHPDCCNDGEISEENLQQKILDLKKMYQEHKEYIVAIGECGIDTYYPGSENSLDLQKKLFAAQCDVAKELGLPLMVHIRKDFAAAFEILQQYTDLTVYVHCRGFSPKEFEILNFKFSPSEDKEIGKGRLYIGFCGNVTYKKADDLRETLKIIPLTQLLLETDAPRLSPQIVRGTTNHPANVQHIYTFVAEYLNMVPETLAEQVEQNFRAVYGL